MDDLDIVRGDQFFAGRCRALGLHPLLKRPCRLKVLVRDPDDDAAGRSDCRSVDPPYEPGTDDRRADGLFPGADVWSLRHRQHGILHEASLLKTEEDFLLLQPKNITSDTPKSKERSTSYVVCGKTFV